MNKRGMASESGTSAAAAVILLIGLVIVAYVLIIPDDAREDVLKGREIDFDDFDDRDRDRDRDRDDDDDRDRTILLRNPGLLVPTGKDDVEKKFASINLFDTSQKQNKKLADKVLVSSSLFSDKYEDLDFIVENRDDLERLSLFFNIKEARGSIRIQLNGKTVFEGSLDSGDVPIELPVVNLGNRNRIRISGSEVGFAFLSRNAFELRDIELIQDFNLLNKAELRTFEVGRAEAIDDARMDFFVNCIEVNSDQGILRVFFE